MTRPNKQQEAARRFEAWVAKTHQFDTNIEIISRDIGVSSRYLRAICHHLLGTSPKQYLLRHQLSTARRLLQTMDVSVTHAATTVQFHDLSRFAIKYRELFGELPSQTARWPSD